jgi:hypothetical protein
MPVIDFCDASYLMSVFKINSCMHTKTYPVQEKLHTDMLREKYGDCKLSILYQDATVRKVLLLDGLGIGRIYAVTSKTKEWMYNKEMLDTDKAIQQGEKIGEAFQKRDFLVRKNVLDVYTATLSPWLRRAFCTIETFAKARNTELIVKKGDKIYNYAHIAEVYSTDFLSSVVSDEDKAQINISFHALKASGFSREEIWGLVG